MLRQGARGLPFALLRISIGRAVYSIPGVDHTSRSADTKIFPAENFHRGNSRRKSFRVPWIDWRARFDRAIVGVYSVNENIVHAGIKLDGGRG